MRSLLRRVPSRPIVRIGIICVVIAGLAVACAGALARGGDHSARHRQLERSGRSAWLHVSKRRKSGHHVRRGHRHHARSTRKPTAKPGGSRPASGPSSPAPTGSGPTATGSGPTATGGGTSAGGAGAGGGDTKTACVYPSEHISILEQFDHLVGRDIRCVVVFNDASSDWSSWENPWFLNTYADMSWGAWATAPGTHRQLVITQNLFPSSENSADWLSLGASGAFEGYARALATNLVDAGLGSSIIRLAHEANGTWYPDSIPNTTAGDALWVQFWRNTVLAMRSVPGAHFRFDWTVNSYYRSVPLASFYPGDDVVDIIGIDAYDSAVWSGSDRWSTIYSRPMGVQQVESFAAAHGKPLSIPEWGIGPSIAPTEGAGGDDPAYVNGIAGVVAGANVAYQSYFFSGEESMQLLNSPLSIAAYQQHFGPSGDALSPGTQGTQKLPTVSSPALAVLTGPAYASTVPAGPISFTFEAQAGYTPMCSLDGQPWRACTTSTSDTLQGLSAGYHRWSVQVSDTADSVTLVQRAFVVS